MIIVVIGKGHVGRSIGEGWKNSGHQVSYGVRAPVARDEFEIVRAIAGADIVAIATPWDAVPDVCRAIGADFNKIIIDCTNPVIMGAAGPVDKLGHILSSGEQVQNWCPKAVVFKTLNQTGFETLANAKLFAQKPMMLVTGDDVTKKPIVMQLVMDLGLDAVDAGPLSNSGRLEDFARLWMDLAFKRGLGRNFAFTLTKRLTEENTK